MREVTLDPSTGGQLSSLLEEAMAGETTVIVGSDGSSAVLMSYAEYERLLQRPKFGWLLANSPIGDGDIEPVREPARALTRHQVPL